MRLRSEKRRGVIALLVAICMFALLGICAIVLDGGIMMHNKRKVQGAADAAALAAAEDLYYNYATNKGLDLSGTANTAATTVAADNGYATGVVVNIPPKTANTTYFNGKAGYVEVIITYQQPRYFSTIWGSTKTPVIAHAVACGTWAGSGTGLLVLDATGSSTIVNGNGNLTVANASITVDSNSSAAAAANGNGLVKAPQINITGSNSTSGNGLFSGTVTTGVSPMPDPLAYLPAPDPSTLPLQPSVKATHGLITLMPGHYKGGISVSSNASLTLTPGIYYMDGGGFSFSGNGSLLGNGVLIYNEPAISSDTISISGNGAITMSPMLTGIYQGITLWQDRNSNVPVSITGNGKLNITGTIYVAGAPLNITGNGANNQFGGQCICYTVKAAGNGACNVIWNPNIIGKARTIGLVE